MLGIATVFFERGAGHIAIQIRDAVKHHLSLNTPILARMSLADGKKQIKFWDDFHHSNIYLYPDYNIPDDHFRQWIKANSIKKIIFVEEHFTRNLIDVCLDMGIDAYNYVVWENLNTGDLSFYRKFKRLICPVRCTYDLLIKCGLDNAIYVPWGVNLDMFRYHEPPKNKIARVFFPAGYGGVYGRKNEQAMWEAMSTIIPRGCAILHVHTQVNGKTEKGQGFLKTYGSVSRYEHIKMIADADIVAMPSKWEGNGLGFYEAMAIGRPVVTVDAPPMNEHVKEWVNGLYANVKEWKEYPGIFVKAVEVNTDDLARKLMWISEDKDLLYRLQTGARLYAEENFNWYKNSKKLIEAVTC